MERFITNGLSLEAGEHAVLLLHGLCATPIEVERLGKHLHAGGLSVFAPEIRGYSYGMPAGDHENWLAQACDCVQRLRLCHKTVSVVGISMGATLALAVAEEERIDSLVMLSAALGYDGWAMPWYAFLINMLPLVPFKQHYQYREAEPFGVKNREMRAMVRKSLETDQVSEAGGESITLKHLAEGMRLIKRVRKHAGMVQCPALIMHAVEDETVSIKNAEWVFRRISSPSKDLIYLGDSYHMITIDNERETVFHETERFLKRSLNAALQTQAFETPPLLSRELRRLLKTK